MLTYPSFDIRDVTGIISILRSGQAQAKRAHLAKHVWQLQGSGQAIAFGEPDGPQAVSSLTDDQRGQVQEACDEIQAYLECEDADVPVGAEAARDRPFLRMLLEMALKFFMDQMIPKTP